MGRAKKQTLDEQIRRAQEEYIKTRKRCDELAKEIDRLSRLKQDEMAKNIIAALAKSSKSYEEVIKFINGDLSEDD